ncbi:MAG: SDR family oxidoreductase [Deinococcota bacterium]
MNLTDTHAVITGASSGIGTALATALAHEGVHLHLLGRDSSKLEHVRERIQTDVNHAITIQVHAFDLTDDAEVTAFCHAQHDAAIDILIHSAGVVELGKLADSSIDTLDWHYTVNVRTPYLLTKGLLDQLEASSGHIVFINSGAGLRANAGWGQYAMSKFALKALADSLRAELDSVRVLSVYPGRTATPMQQHVYEQEGKSYDPEPLIQPEDVAQQVISALRLPRRASVIDLNIRTS